jgi:hypothetical protein
MASGRKASPAVNILPDFGEIFRALDKKATDIARIEQTGIEIIQIFRVRFASIGLFSFTADIVPQNLQRSQEGAPPSRRHRFPERRPRLVCCFCGCHPPGRMMWPKRIWELDFSYNI